MQIKARFYGHWWGGKKWINQKTTKVLRFPLDSSPIIRIIPFTTSRYDLALRGRSLTTKETPLRQRPEQVLDWSDVPTSV